MRVDGHCCTAGLNKHAGPSYMIFDTSAGLGRDGMRRTTHPKEGNAGGRGAGTDRITSASIRGVQKSVNGLDIPSPLSNTFLLSQPIKTV
jgi:hypothetical protein